MKLRLYNSLTHQKDIFTPRQKNKVSLYTCGPTVYNYAHLGNLRTYIFEDVLRRVLIVNGYEVDQVMNITDVGHLTDDGDSGEDKMEKGARREGKTAQEIASFYTQAFLDDALALNIVLPKKMPHAADKKYIEAQINLIKTLEQKGYTYQTSDGVYFDSTKFKDYGKMAQLDIANLQEGARVSKNKEKHHPTDFALWKFSPQDKKRQMEWQSPWGIGFPGWHIECSAMAIKELGKTIDIHCGGIDHLPVHHTNEIAQSEAATGKQFSRFFLHAEHLLINEGRMGKSEGNFLTLQSLKDKKFDPLTYRYFVLGAHYRSKLNFSWEALKNSQQAYDKLISNLAGWETPTMENQDYDERFLAAVNDDLNMPKALAIFWDIVKTNLTSAQKMAQVFAMDKIFGLSLQEKSQQLKTKIGQAQEEIRALLQERETARQMKNFQRADEIRFQIEKRGLLVEDTKEGSLLKIKD